MQEWLKAVVQDPWFAFSGWIIGAFSLIIAVVFYRRSKRDKAPFYSVHTNTLIEQLQTKVPSLEVSYAGHDEPIMNLSVSRISFWNEGRATIHKADIARKSPLILSVGGGVKILDAEVLYDSSDGNAFDIAKTPERTEAYILFDHIDHHEGAIFQVVHTGTARDRVELRGKIKGTQVKLFKGSKLGGVLSLALALPVVFIAAMLVDFAGMPDWLKFVLALVVGTMTGFGGSILKYRQPVSVFRDVPFYEKVLDE